MSVKMKYSLINSSFAFKKPRPLLPAMAAMANQHPPQQHPVAVNEDDFFDHIFSTPTSYASVVEAGAPLHRSSADSSGVLRGGPFPLGLSLQHGLSSANQPREEPDRKAVSE